MRPQPTEAMMRLTDMRNALCVPAARQSTATDRQRRMERLSSIACGFLTVCFCFLTATFAVADESNDRQIISAFYLEIAELNALGIACRDYLSMDTVPINQKLMQYWDAQNGVPAPRSVLYETIKEIRANLQS